MIEEPVEEHRLVERPWTVIALVAWTTLGSLWSLLFSDGARPLDILLNLALTSLFVWGFWTARRWAYSLTFALTVLSAIFLIIVLVTDQAALIVGSKILWVVNLAGYLFLLRHPATKRFIGIDKGSRPQRPSGPADRGGRWSQALAISIFGILAVGLPLLWAFGSLDGPLLIAGIVACAGSGILVLVLGLPKKQESVP